MTQAYLKQQREISEKQAASETSDFTVTYYAVCHLLEIATRHTHLIAPETLDVLEKVLSGKRFSRQRQGLFLFRQAANALVQVMQRSNGDGALVHQAEARLSRALATTEGNAHRAAAESLGSLPPSVQGFELDAPTPESPRAVRWKKLLSEKGLRPADNGRPKGRSLVFSLADDPDHLLVVKYARTAAENNGLQAEAQWMAHLRNRSFPARFDVPEPIAVDGTYLIRPAGLPGPGEIGAGAKGRAFNAGAIAFIANRGYFTYPHHCASRNGTSDADFGEMITRNAQLLGHLSGMGLVHSAPIPLFHNRVQVDRRRDGGLYEWFRAGRLDRWLASCAYPNMGETGVRDFEHIEPHCRNGEDGESLRLYRNIGNHFLSLFLIIGSYFRCKDPSRSGWNGRGQPVDARDLFCKEGLIRWISGIFNNYYSGFVGTPFAGELPLDIPGLADRMIEEMGVDRHMEEVLRTPDQDAMSPGEFRRFLRERGFSDERIRETEKGRADIVFQSGPHLGGFNRPISLPEMILAVETFSALCIAGRYRKYRNGCS